MTIFHFQIGIGRLRIPIEIKAHDCADALQRLQEILHCPVIAKAWAGNRDGGKTYFPELRGRPLFKPSKDDAPLPPPLRRVSFEALSPFA